MSVVSRKIVTVLFADVVNWTPIGEALDPESVRTMMARYFEEMRAVIERHGGTVEKYIGDAIMAVFGIPQLHEDDALRAVRAAAEMRDALARLNGDLPAKLSIRTGLNTGEVVAGEGHTLVTGDAVTTAARLETSAESGEIRIGEPTYVLVRDAVLAEPVGPVTLKGKAAPVEAWRVTAVLPGVPGRARRLDTPLVGRDGELALLRQAYTRAVAQRSAYLFTILGSAGVGKSRLGSELMREIGGEATTLVGRALPYGEGITYWPLRDVVRSVDDLAARVGQEDAEALAGATGTGGPDGGGGASSEEIRRAVRRLFEALATDRPLVVYFDDVHWADPTFLDLLEHLADAIRDAPVVLVCLARPELLEERPLWAGGKLNATTILLEPLDAEGAEQLLEHLGAEALTERLRDEIIRGAEGNPLFLEEMVEMAHEDPSAVAVPPTIQALLTARLERLPAAERSVAAAAAVVGRFFSRAAVEAVLDTDAADVLTALARKEVIRPQLVPFAEGDAYRFRHMLIRDAAYEGLPKAVRAELHLRAAEWLETTAREVEELVGWHLERAAIFRQELGQPDGGLSGRAASTLAVAGRRALDRGDMTAAVSLLTRATVMWRDDERGRLEVAPWLASALRNIGELPRAEGVLEAALATEAAAAHPGLRAHALLEKATTDVQLSPSTWLAAAVDAGTEALAIFEEAGDDAGLAHAHYHLAIADLYKARLADAEARLVRAVGHSRLAGDRRLRAAASGSLATALYFGPAPATAAIARCRELLEEEPATTASIPVRCALGAIEAMNGRLDAAREQLSTAVTIIEEWSIPMWLADARLYRGIVELGAGAYDEAATSLALALETVESAGSGDGFIAALLARAHYALGDVRRAEELALQAERDADAFPWTQVAWRGARARVAAAVGRLDEAEALAREAIAIVAATDLLSMHAEALVDLAVVLRERHDAANAVDAAREAEALYERKENVVGAAAARSLFLALTTSGAPQ